MKKIDEIDRNMAVATRLEDSDVQWFDVHDAPISLHGFCAPQRGEPFRRLPDSVARGTSEDVAVLALHTAGGRARFATDSPWVAIHAEMAGAELMDHMPCTGVFGFDLYARTDGAETYCGTFRPGVGMRHGYESKLPLPAGTNELTLHFPLYNRVDRLFVGIREGSRLMAARGYSRPLPVVYYGSSITQGGCASRPGNSYQAMISRMLDCDHINLGFSGSAKGEDAIVRYMAGLEMSAFVCDYDHNAPTAEHLRATHGKLFRTIRERQPLLPILLISHPDQRDPATAERRAIIRETYERALAAGDRHVAFLDGAELFAGPQSDDCTVDGIHPNDLGFYRMARRIAPEIAALLAR